MLHLVVVIQFILEPQKTIRNDYKQKKPFLVLLKNGIALPTMIFDVVY